VSRYVDRLWIEKSKSAYCRLLASHDEDREVLFQDPPLQQWLEDSTLSLNIEPIQAHRMCKVGHLMGYHSIAVNTKTLVKSIQLQPQMKGIDLEARIEFVNLEPGNYSARTKFKIIQLYVAWDKAATARKALIQLYSSAAGGVFPNGTPARFIPDVQDTRFIRTAEAKQAYIRSLRKHIRFMQSTKTHSSYNIVGLDTQVSGLGGYSLREAIMRIKSSSNVHLFVAVDWSPERDSVTFAFRKELEDEAMTMISALPIFLIAYFKSRLIWTWFSPEAQISESEYRWDSERGIVPLASSGLTNTNLPDWELLDEDDEDEEIISPQRVIQPFTLELGPIPAPYGDTGSFVTRAYDTGEILPPSMSATNPFAATSHSTPTYSVSSTLTTSPEDLEMVQLLISRLREPSVATVLKDILKNPSGTQSHPSGTDYHE
jgi:hypothetical protein